MKENKLVVVLNFFIVLKELDILSGDKKRDVARQFQVIPTDLELE